VVQLPAPVHAKFLTLNDSGQNSGKEVFTKRTTGPDGLEYSPLELMLFKQQHADLEAKFIKSVLKSEIKGCVKVRISIELVVTSNCLSKITTANVCETIRFYARRRIVHRLRLLSRNLLLMARRCMMP